MNKGLTKLALADNIGQQKLYASSVSENDEETVQTASGAWGVQVGAFSNYAKARNFALSVKQKAKSTVLANARIDIEPARKGAAVVYRSKLIGMEKNEADKTCNRLKKSNQSCIVVASDDNPQLAMAEQQQ